MSYEAPISNGMSCIDLNGLWSEVVHIYLVDEKRKEGRRSG